MTDPTSSWNGDELHHLLVRLWENRHPSLTFPEITEMDNLFELDIIDSLGVVELILYMEEQRGQEVDLIEMDPEVLFTLGGIRHFISGHE